MPKTKVASTKKNKKMFMSLMIIGSLLVIGVITVGVLFATGVIVAKSANPKFPKTFNKGTCEGGRRTGSACTPGMGANKTMDPTNFPNGTSIDCPANKNDENYPKPYQVCKLPPNFMKGRCASGSRTGNECTPGMGGHKYNPTKYTNDTSHDCPANKDATDPNGKKTYPKPYQKCKLDD